MLRKLAKLYISGHFEKMSNLLRAEHNLNECNTYFLSICYKELKEFNKALHLLYAIPDFDCKDSNAKAQIGCCLMYTGEIQKGLEIIQTANHYESLCDAGRACFDIGLLDESTNDLDFDFLVQICCYCFVATFCSRSVSVYTTGTVSFRNLISQNGSFFQRNFLSLPIIFCLNRNLEKRFEEFHLVDYKIIIFSFISTKT